MILILLSISWANINYQLIFLRKKKHYACGRWLDDVVMSACVILSLDDVNESYHLTNKGGFE